MKKGKKKRKKGRTPRCQKMAAILDRSFCAWRQDGAERHRKLPQKKRRLKMVLWDFNFILYLYLSSVLSRREESSVSIHRKTLWVIYFDIFIHLIFFPSVVLYFTISVSFKENMIRMICIIEKRIYISKKVINGHKNIDDCLKHGEKSSVIKPHCLECSD